MAEATNNPGAFVLEVAEVGKDVLATFTEYVLSRKVQDRRLETMLAIISITTSLLKNLGSTLNTYQNVVHIKDEVTRPMCETCKDDFDKLTAMSKEAKEKGMWITESQLSGQSVATEVDPWFIFNVALGGPEKGEQFLSRMDATRFGLVALNDTIKYKILRELDRQKCLKPKQVEEYKNLTVLLPLLVQSLERTEKDKKERLALEAKSQETPKSNKIKTDVKEKAGVVEPIESEDTDASSDITITETNLESKDQKKQKKKQVKFVEDDDDSRSVQSYDPWSEIRFHEDSKVVYEEWVIRWNESKRDARKSWGFFGLKIKEYYEDPGFWGIDPELRSIAELKAQHENAAAGMSDSQYRASVEKVIKSLPQEARDMIDGLIQDRHQATSNERYIRQWSVAAVRPKQKNIYNPGKNWTKTKKSTDWLIMIKGETASREERTRPNRWSDPWRKPYHARHPEHNYGRFDGRDYRRRNEYGAVEPYARDMPIGRPRSPVQIMEYEGLREVDPVPNKPVHDAFRPETIAVGLFASHEDAEKKMDKILDDMAGDLTV